MGLCLKDEAMRPLACLSVLLTLCGCTLAQPVAEGAVPWSQLSLSACRVDEFLQQRPGSDGRGVVIAVLDCGVDPGVPGLQRTPDGKIKVIDVQDFSGEGDVELSKLPGGVTEGKLVHHADDGTPIEYGPPTAELPAGELTYWFGAIDESTFATADLADLNDNGLTDDKFAVCVVVPDGGDDDDAVAYVDSDMDRDFADEKPLKNYHLRYDTFTFARGHKEEQITTLTCAVNVFLHDEKVVVHFDDGGHGTHVAGIAAAYRINNQPGFNGVAPGAQVISLKIGDNRLAGGATTTGAKKRAFEYAAKFAREHNVPVVCNMSYGVGSEIEGHSDIDKLVDRVCRENPDLIVCLSGGNEGPGISTVGTPSAAAHAIAVGALLAAETARDAMGAVIETPQMAVFSSRGGELDKPDFVAPGYATSTVPKWITEGDFWSGTSMASPYAAGMAALLVSDAIQRHPDTPIRSFWVKSALKASGRPVAGYNALDVGAGLPDMPRAAEVLDDLVANAADDPLAGYKITTENPMAVGGKSEAAYWRSEYHPVDEPQVFTIEPEFAPLGDADRKTAFTRRFALRSDQPWCRPREEQIYLRSENSAAVRVDYIEDMLSEPGLYVATVEALDGNRVAFRLLNTIVVPHRFDASNKYRVSLSDQQVEGWKVRRYFLATPAGASALQMTIRAVDDQPSTVRTSLFAPDGDEHRNGEFRLNTHEGEDEATWSFSEGLTPGVWELCVLSARPDEVSAYNLDIRFVGLHADPPTITDWSHPVGGLPEGTVTVINLFASPVPVKVTGEIEGYRQTLRETLTAEDDTAEKSISFNPSVRAVRITCKFSEEDFGRFTDVAVNVYDSDGESIASDGMTVKELTLVAENPDPEATSTSAKLVVRAAFADPDCTDAAALSLQLDYLYVDSPDIKVTHNDEERFTLYPGMSSELSFALQEAPPAAPPETVTIGSLRLEHAATGESVLEVPIEKGS
jgi:tripeptidyl-peptidase-2